ncbi:GTP 3',8-cyclase MoaA [Candidatus Harpocratesius sp.]
MKLIDRFHREIKRFRISITSDCNLFCVYCHHEGNPDSNAHIYTPLVQLSRLVPLIKTYNITNIKITGGEPLLHPNILDIIRLFSNIPTVKDISLTSNGIFLEKYAHDLKQAGLNRINIGCDTINDSTDKSLKKIEKGLLLAKEEGILPIKLNMVILKGVNEDQVEPLLKFCEKHGFILQIIELINTNDAFFSKFHKDLTYLEANIARKALKVISREVQDRKQYVLPSGAIIEFVQPVHNSKFCAKCNTLRVTNDFQFQPCLNRYDNLVPIGKNIEKSLAQAVMQREPFNVSKQS